MDRSFDMVKASFFADSFSLGTHGMKPLWGQENTDLFQNLNAPPENSPIINRSSGQLSPWGDSQLILLEHLIQEKGFSPELFAQDWQYEMKRYDGYKSPCTLETLEKLNQGNPPLDCGCLEPVIHPIASIAPLVWFYQDDLDALLNFTRIYTGMTHKHPLVQETVTLIARAVFTILKGEELIPAILAVCSHLSGSQAASLLLSGLESDDLETQEAFQSFGNGPEILSVLPSLGHLLGKYASDSESAYLNNLYAGGETAPRAMVLALFLGASGGLEGIDPDLFLQVQKMNHVDRLLES